MVWYVVIVGLAGVIALGILSLLVLGIASQRRPMLGLVEGRLRPCPASPNCMSSEASDADHRTEPIPFAQSPEAAFDRLRTIVSEMSGARVVTTTGRYMHVEFTSSVFRLVDDVEFRVDADSHVIHFRSASRVGHSDLGVNRKRMSTIAEAFTTPRDM